MATNIEYITISGKGAGGNFLLKAFSCGSLFDVPRVLSFFAVRLVSK